MFAARKLCIFIFILLVFVAKLAQGIEITITLKSGRSIEGKLLSMTTERIQLDPKGAVSLLTIKGTDITSLAFDETGEILHFPITEAQIPLNIRGKEKYHRLSYYHSFFELYLFGGVSSEKTVAYYVACDDDGKCYLFPMIYENGGLGGGGISGYYDTPRIWGLDIALDFEAAVISAKMKTTMSNKEVDLLDGTAIAIDVVFSLYPFPGRITKYPTPFLFVGAGIRAIGMEDDYGNKASETQGALIYGIGARWQISENIALELKKRFVYSTLEDVDAFTLNETRLELHLTVNRY